uniref:Phosphopantothenoylcysteine decarboxylase n=1 Tax=Globodera rostochiensis TaxID=31243 RepID=A0A914HHF5_GLORO
MASPSNTDNEEIPQKRKRVNDDSGATTTAENNGAERAKVTAVSHRAPFDASHRISRLGGKFHVLLALTGSVATIKIEELIAELHKQSPANRLAIKVIATQSALNFFDASDVQETIYDDRDEWNMWKKRGDPVLHIELRKWADSLLIAPLDANTLAKVANGICDNLVTSVVRAWDQRKPLYFAPAMNTAMWDNPLTYQHMKTLKELLLYREIPTIEKELMCGDKGYGAMASVQMIASIIALSSASQLELRCQMYIFGYGSLLWNPNFPYDEAIRGVVVGYVRRFCQLSPDHRGTPDNVLFILNPDKAVENTLKYLDHREKAGYRLKRVKFYPDDGSEPFELSVYISEADRRNIYHSGPTGVDDIVKQIIRSRGRSGSNLEYALRLADCQRRMAPNFWDEHLFEIEAKLLRECEYLRHEDEILEKLNYNLSYLAKKRNKVEA